MKPRTKLHHRVVQLSEELFPISKKQIEWAKTECLHHLGYANKSNVGCLDCGEVFELELVNRKKAVCPSCNTKIDVVRTRNTTKEQSNFFAITEVVDEFQVVRNFQISSKHKKGWKAEITVTEVLQYWIQEDGKVTYFGMRNDINWGRESYSGLMEIRDPKSNYYYGMKYQVYASKYHPDSEFKPEYTKYGINHNLRGLPILEAIKEIPRDSKLETLVKAKQYSMLGKQNELWRYWNSIKICLRNKYKVREASMYFDYLDLLKYFKKDLRNAKFVCPKNLKKEHDVLMNKKRKILEAERFEQERINAIKRQEDLRKARVDYVKRFSKFFSLEFSSGELSITVLKSVDEFKEEGDDLKHCLFTNEYYLKEKSLILSAKVNGKRAETIEVSLDKMEIVQSRGLNNVSTEYHDKIVSLVNRNIQRIAEKSKGKTLQMNQNNQAMQIAI